MGKRKSPLDVQGTYESRPEKGEKKKSALIRRSVFLIKEAVNLFIVEGGEGRYFGRETIGKKMRRGGGKRKGRSSKLEEKRDFAFCLQRGCSLVDELRKG